MNGPTSYIAGGLVLLTACSISPLQQKVDVGKEPFVVFVAEGGDGNTDLFASLPGGGEISQLTFTSLKESRPKLTKAGGLVAFIRSRSPAHPDQQDVVVMNLLSGAERRIQLPTEAGTAVALGWSDDENGLYIQATSGKWHVDAPPAAPNPTPVAASQLGTADSALNVLLGTPTFAEAKECNGGGVCVTGPSGEPSVLSPIGSEPFRWGADSVAWLEAGVIVVRPLGPGPSRRIDWNNSTVTGQRQASYARGED